MCKSGKFRVHGFTLIELLIVVAIIAILAAIAVPNFLEAQTRAKVSRVRADVRSVATALESYKIDSNLYPPAAEFPHAAMRALRLNPEYSARVPSWLTTPISYMTSLPDDVFYPNQFTDPRKHWNRYVYFNYEEYKKFYPANQSYARLYEQTGGYLFYSFGPDKSDNQTGSDKPGYNGTFSLYDASNGTLSYGNIIRTARSPEGQLL